MCGRFSFFARRADIAGAFPFVLLAPDFDAVVPRRYNIAPTQRTTIVRGDRHASLATWGFGMPHTFNARAESVAERPLYRRSFVERPALVPANGWFEWEPTPSGKRPFYITAEDERPLLFAGIWNLRESSPCFSILTRASRFELAPIHHREPVVIEPADALHWLDEHTSPQQRHQLLVPRSDRAPHFYPREVRRAVNDIGNDGADLLASPTSTESVRDLPLFPLSPEP
ncbi:MAG: SOS response-associated peptidase [Candidatus Eremiobacteraeota bacterium]|uniref:Abasic site processing protein n=1 Tax=mine drainage metagenome TaxID=410659 RepID=E6PIY1_9ZZZZ|nr:SOS response-associated peptidase [Candidatus Eremiobacteraeota bacterium]